ncbi:hypothetical protein BaRGS_00015030 [Batillaria attramentaria]|uniref:Uncharacterized protein n=1 Tax=Batillaria attramentaria TaxID=370345 RepID=A0ABD0L379_9CAEN
MLYREGCSCACCTERLVPAYAVQRGLYLHMLYRDGCSCICSTERVVPAYAVQRGLCLHMLYREGCACICCTERVVPAYAVQRGLYLHMLYRKGCACICCKKKNLVSSWEESDVVPVKRGGHTCYTKEVAVATKGNFAACIHCDCCAHEMLLAAVPRGMVSLHVHRWGMTAVPVCWPTTTTTKK